MTSFITEHWNKWLKYFPIERFDAYFTEEYVRLYSDNNHKAVCYICEDNGKVLIFPYLQRSFKFKDNIYYDFETAYGYGGPITNIDDKEFSDKALHLFMDKCKTQNYLTGFVRFCPLLKNYELCDGIFPILKDRSTIAINLAMSLDDVWMNEIHTKNRNVIKKGTKDGLTFEADYDFKYLPEFITLYNATMDKLDATDFYYFDDKYYQQLVSTMPNCFLGVVKYNNQIVSTAIFFYTEVYGHYHLSGSDKNALKFMPNNFMLWNAAKELHGKGVKYFHLGGGTTYAADDSLLGFKRKFSKSFYDFYLGKIIFNEDIYAKICFDWEDKNSNKKETYKNILQKYKY